MPGVPRTPASEPSATSAHHHHLGRRPDDIYMSSATFWLESSSHPCLPRPQFTPYAVDTQWLFMSGFKVFSDAEKAAAPTLVAALQLFLWGLVLGWALVLQQRWYVCGGSSSWDRVPGSGSEERDGCCSVVSKPGDDVAHHFLPSWTRQRAHTTTSRHLHLYHFHLLPQSESLQPHQSRAHSQQATAPAPWPTCTATAPDFTVTAVTATTDMRWTLVCVRRQDGGKS